MLTADRLRELYNYDPETGIFTHRKSRRGRSTKAGRVAGCSSNSHGRQTVGADGKVYLAYRLAWLYVTGQWPASDVDHINGDKSDNRFSNLRLATVSQNLANAKKPVTNTSGYKGVSWNKNAKKWRSMIKRDGKVTHLGYFETPEAAHAAYMNKAREFFGEFARAA
jgi:hypothetical protein